MAIEPALIDFDSDTRNGIKMIRDALDHYAQSQGWQSEDYYIFMAINTKWRKISVGLFSSHFEREKIDHFEYLDEVWDFLKDDLKGQPEIYDSIGLFLSTLDAYGFMVNRSYGDDMIEVDDDYLNPGKPVLRVAPSPTGS